MQFRRRAAAIIVQSSALRCDDLSGSALAAGAGRNSIGDHCTTPRAKVSCESRDTSPQSINNYYVQRRIALYCCGVSVICQKIVCLQFSCDIVNIVVFTLEKVIV